MHQVEEQSKKRQPFFSLRDWLRLVGVILIIAAVGALLRPILPDHRRRSCQWNLKELASAVRMYMEDNHGSLPSSLNRDPKTKLFIPAFCTVVNSWTGAVPAKSPTYADALRSYIKSLDRLWCPNDAIHDKSPSTLTSFVYRPAIDQAAVSGHGREKDFAYPSKQILFFERLAYDKGRVAEGWQKGVKLDCVYLDGHVAYAGAPDATMSDIPRANIPDEPGPALNKALNQPGWPCWFNYDVKTKTGVKRKAWDPRRYRDEVR